MKKKKKSLSDIRLEIRNDVLKRARRHIKENDTIKMMLSNFKEHWKTHGWVLDYEYYLEESGFSQTMFNAILELSGYKVSYNKFMLSVVIGKSKK